MNFVLIQKLLDINPLTADLVGMSFSFNSSEAYYVPFPPDKKQTQDRLQNFIPLFKDKKILKIGQNVKYDLQVLNNYNIIPGGKYLIQ